METILIIEDDPAMLRGLKDNFEFKGYSVLAAADGEEGLNAALDKKPDLILLDIMLPKINGYEVCRLIRQEHLDMPIIMLTAKGEESDIVLGLNLGADDYVTKPFSIKELAQLDGAFVISGSGVVEAAGRHLDAVNTVTRQLKGLGSRHRAAASITMHSEAIAVVVSQSSGRVTVFDEGKIIASLDPVISTRVV